jgi:predicted amidohydrolase
MKRITGILTIALLVSYSGHAGAADNTVRVASLSILPEKWNKAANADKIERMVRQAAKEGAEVVITPEGVLEGYVVNEVRRERDPQRKVELTRRFEALAEPIDGPYLKRFRQLADELDIHLVLGFLEREGDRLLNTAALIGPDGGIVGKYHKTHLHQGYTDNPPGYVPGDDYPVFDIGRFKIGIMICFDRQPPEPARILALGGADLIACPAYGSYGDWNTRLMQVRAYENQVYVVFTNPNDNLIIDPDGEILGEGRTDSMVIRDLDFSRPLRQRQSIVRRRPETYGALTAK